MTERVVSSYYAPNYRTLESLLFIVNALFSFTVLIGNSVWSTNNTLYIYSTMYGFSWFVCIASLLLSGVYILVNYITNYYHILDIFAKNVAMCIMSLIASIFWFISAIGVTILARDCSNYRNAYWYVYYYDDTKDAIKNTCSGIIVSATFSFLCWGVWLVILGNFLMVLVKLYKQERSDVTEMTETPPENIALEKNVNVKDTERNENTEHNNNTEHNESTEHNENTKHNENTEHNENTKHNESTEHNENTDNNDVIDMYANKKM